MIKTMLTGIFFLCATTIFSQEHKPFKGSIINDYGSEDLMAKLVVENDSTYLLKQINGSTLKIVVDNKWVKLPKTLEMKRKSNKL